MKFASALVASLACLTSSVSAGAPIETDAYITYKNGHHAEPHVTDTMLLNLAEAIADDDQNGSEVDDHITAIFDSDKIITTKDIDNYFNLQITTKLYFGSEQEPHDLILDTGSMWTWVQTSDCWSCGTHNNFNPKASKTWTDLEESDGRMMATGYGSGAVFGYAGTDKVCLLPHEMCADEHRISAVVAETGLDTLVGDGILGLGPDTLTDMPKLFIDSLHEQGVIEDRSFAFLVGLNHGLPSKFMVGGYDLKKYAKGPIQWHNTMDPHKTWYVDWTGVSFGDHQLELDDTVMLPDTGTSFISLPEKTMDHLLSIMHEEYGTEKPKLYPVGLWGARCTKEQFDAMPDLNFVIDSTSYVISKSQYLINRNGHCVLQIAPTGNTGKAYLGINFFENYYGIFDMDNKRVGFAESVYSELTPQQSQEHNAQILLNMSSREELDYYFESSGLPNGTQYLVASLVALSTVLGYALTKCVVRKSAADDEQKAARKALAQVLNQQAGIPTSPSNRGKQDINDFAQDDEMFDVPLDDTVGAYVGPEVHSDMLSNHSESNPARYYSPAAEETANKTPLAHEEDEYTFEVLI